jgi:hypothetical protein
MTTPESETTVYHLCVAYSKEKLEAEVTQLLREGWLLLGSTQLTSGKEYICFAQPMVKTVRQPPAGESTPP